MFRTKKDVDRHVSFMLGKIKDEKERSSRGYQIARLYYDIAEYELAKRYICVFLSVRETVPQAHKLHGQILAALGEKDKALVAYKRSYDLDNSQKDLVLKICELCTQTNIDPGRATFWLEKAERLFPSSEAVFKLKQIIVEMKSDGDTRDLENLLVSEIANRPLDVNLRVKLLRLYLKTGRFENAYNTAVESDNKMMFVNSVDWYEALTDIYQVYRNEKGCAGNISFYMQNLFALSRVVYLRMCFREPVSAVEMLHVLDQTLQEAINITGLTEEWLAFLEEIQGQIFFLAGTLLLKRAQKGQQSWKDVKPLAGMCYMVSETFKTQDPQSRLFVKISKSEQAKLFDYLHKLSNFRRSQGGHLLKKLSAAKPDWAEITCQTFHAMQGKDKLYDILFTLREQRSKKDKSFLMQSKSFDDTTLSVPLAAQLMRFDKEACLLQPEKLTELTWIALNWYPSINDAPQPSYGFPIFKKLKFSVHSMDSGSPESLCQLDIESFLYASVRCSAYYQQQRHKLGHCDAEEPWLLPSCLCKLLCSREQAEWWEAAYMFYTNTVRENFSMMRHTLMRGIETVRLVGNHGMSTRMIVNLARSFDRRASDMMKLENEGRGGSDHIHCVTERAAFYWKNVLQQLERLQKNQTLPVPKMRLFVVEADREFDCNVMEDLKVIEELKEEASFSLGLVAMNNKEYETAIKCFKNLSNPWASFHTAEIYKRLAKDEETKGTKESREQSAILLNLARDSLYHTMDLLRDKKDHELNTCLSEEVDNVESELQRRNMDESSVSEYETASDSRDEEQETSSPSSSSPNKPALSPVKVYSDVSLKQKPSSDRSKLGHLQPSPERLEAQLRSLSFSQDTLLKMVLERNEDLASINREMVQQLRSSHELIHQLKHELDTSHHNSLMASGFLHPHPGQSPYMSGSPYRPQYPFNPQAGWGSPYNSQMHSPGNIPPFRPPIPPRQNIRPGFGGYSDYPGKPEDEMGPNGHPDDMPYLDGSYYQMGLEDETQYYPPDSSCMQEWPYGNRAGIEGSSTITYTPQNRPPMRQQQQQQQQQNGLIAAQLRGQSLQFSGQPSALPANMPGPGFFSTPHSSMQQPVVHNQGLPSPYTGVVTDTSVQMGNSNTMNTGTSLQQYLQAPQMTTSTFGLQPTQKPFTFGNLSEPNASQAGPVFSNQTTTAGECKTQTKSDTSEVQDLTMQGSSSAVTQKISAGESKALFDEKAKYTSKIGKVMSGHVRIFSSGSSGYVAMEGDNGEVIFKHDFSTVRLLAGFVPQPVSLVVTLPDSKIDETINLTFDDPAQASRFKELFKQLTENIKAATSTATNKLVPPTPAPKPALAFSGKPLTTSVSGGNESKFGGFTFSTTPIFKPPQEPTSETKTSPGFKLKESSLTVTSPSTVTQVKPFSGFSFGTAKPSVADSTSTTSSFANKGSVDAVKSPSQGKETFILGQNTSTPTTTTSVQSLQSNFGFKGFKHTGKQLFQTSTPTQEEEKVEEYEPNVDFKPLIELPELVEVKTGEENEKKLFGERSRLFRYDTETEQWKERGIGEMKILESKDGKRFRILMRREQVLKICANHNISPEMKLVPMHTSDRAWCWTAMDFSDEEMKTEQFAIKFKTKDIAANFKETFENCQKQLSENPSNDDSDKIFQEAKEPEVTQKDKESFADKFKPKPGSWECTGCYCRNDAADLKCPACQTAKPGATLEKADIKEGKSVGSGFQFGKISGTTGGFSFVSEKPVESSKEIPFFDKFRPKPGSWECSGCYCRNAADDLQCPACQTLKPGVTKEDIEKKPQTTGISGAGGFQFGASGGFTFGGGKSMMNIFSKPNKVEDSLPSITPPGGFTFGVSVKSVETKAETKPTEVKSDTVNKNSTLAALLTADDEPSQTALDKFSFVPAPKSGGFVFGSTPKPGGFQFNLGKITTPVKDQTEAADNKTSQFQFSFSPASKDKSSVPESPKSPQVDEHGLYINKEGEDSHIYFEPVVPLPAKIEVKTGEEEETVLFEHRAKLYRFDNGEWKERGLGNVKILEHKDTKKIRILMRREQVLKLCLNHMITSDLHLNPMPKADGKAWIWYAQDFADEEQKIEQFAIRFKSLDVAQKFKTVFDKAKTKPSASPKSASFQQPFASAEAPIVPASVQITGDKGNKMYSKELDAKEDVVVVFEEKATEEQIARARKYLLPDHFYLYENKPPCPGCIGCQDDDTETPIVSATAQRTGDRGNRMYSKELDAKEAPIVPAGVQITGDKGNKMYSKELDAEESEVVPTLSEALGDKGNKEYSKQLDNQESPSMFTLPEFTDFSQLKGQGFKKVDDSKPFKWSGAGQQLFGVGAVTSTTADDEDVPPASDDIHFEPVIPLPDLVEIKTGDEGWDVLFSHRSKLYRFHNESNQWKERGIGDMKIMTSCGKFRLLMRREQVLKVVCNHMLTPEMNFAPLPTSETTWCWLAQDFSEGEPQIEKLAIKFKTREIFEEFKSVIDECVKQINLAGGDNSYGIQDVNNSAGEEKEKLKSVVKQDNDPAKKEEVQQEEEDDDDDDDDDGDDDDDDEEDDEDVETEEEEEEEEEEYLFEKRVTLFAADSAGAWQKLGMGSLHVMVNDDVGAYSVEMISDDNQKLCNHIISREQRIVIDEKNLSCMWSPTDFSTDEPVRRHFKARFSSPSATKEFYDKYNEGFQMAIQNEISENTGICNVMDKPVMFSRGDNPAEKTGEQSQ